jgi:hypothetical protein
MLSLRRKAFLERGESRVIGKGKHPVNGDDEKYLTAATTNIGLSTDTNLSIVMAGTSPAMTHQKQRWLTSATIHQNKNARSMLRAFFVLFTKRAMRRYAWLAISLPSAACAAASRAIGTRYGEQET